MVLSAIKDALKRHSLHPELFRVMDYAVLPAGKLFRPKLVEALCLDLFGTVSSDALHLASAIELHHAYTLVHDDLPAMDNDLIRRGKPTTHAQFGEWKAILAGDALLIASFAELALIDRNLRGLLKLFSWATGAKGLILGQFLDLGADGKQSIEATVRIHELKTARLIQVATLGSHLLQSTNSQKSVRDFLRLGETIGVTFQLLDDLNELRDTSLSEHEHLINPFLVAPHEAFLSLKKSHQKLLTLVSSYGLKKTGSMLNEYFRDNQKNLLKDWSVVEENLKVAESKIEIYGWITSFA